MLVILVFHSDNCLLRPYGCRRWDVGAASQWLISSDVQPEGLHLVNYPPRTSLRPLFEQLQEMGDGFVKGCFNFAGLKKGLLLVAEHGVGELFSSICTLFTNRHLQGKLKFYANESQDLFCQFLAYTLMHAFEKFSGVCRQRVLGRHVHLPGSQVISYCPGRSVEDLSLFLLFFEHLQNLFLVVLDRSDYLLRRQGVKLPQDGLTLPVLPRGRRAYRSIFSWKQGLK